MSLEAQDDSEDDVATAAAAAAAADIRRTLMMMIIMMVRMGPLYVHSASRLQSVVHCGARLSLTTPRGPCMEHESLFIFNSISYPGPPLILIMINVNMMIGRNSIRQAKPC